VALEQLLASMTGGAAALTPGGGFIDPEEVGR
jgi:hypothetical protein